MLTVGRDATTLRKERRTPPRTTVDDKLNTHLVPAFDTFFGFDYLVPGTNDAVPAGQPLKTYIDAIDPTPALTTAPGATNGGKFVASNSPAPGSTIALQFDGSTQALQGPGFRDSFVDQAAYNSNAPAGGGNLDTTFFQLSQAWVYPSSAGQGTDQVVWAVGEENGGVQITSDGFWQLTAVGGASISATNAQVAFDQWTHIAVSRGGGGATLRVNGSTAATASGSFGKWGDFVTLGGNETCPLLFNGKVDNFDIGGNHDGSFVAFDGSDVLFRPGHSPADERAGRRRSRRRRRPGRLRDLVDQRRLQQHLWFGRRVDAREGRLEQRRPRRLL